MAGRLKTEENDKLIAGVKIKKEICEEDADDFEQIQEQFFCDKTIKREELYSQVIIKREPDEIESDFTVKEEEDNKDYTLMGAIEKLKTTIKHSLQTYKEDEIPEPKIKQYNCEQCEKRFTTKDGLKIHTRNHAGVTLYKCEKCGKGLCSKQNLNLHSLIHTGEKPFKCVKCNKDFRDRSNLRKHLRTHMFERVLKCVECKKTFKKQHRLDMHNRKNHVGES